MLRKPGLLAKSARGQVRCEEGTSLTKVQHRAHPLKIQPHPGQWAFSKIVLGGLEWQVSFSCLPEQWSLQRKNAARPLRPYAHQRRTFSRLQPPRCRRTWLPGTPHLPSSLAAASFPNKFKSDFWPFTVPLFICIFWVHASMLINRANKIIQFNPPKLGAQLTSPRPNVFQRSTLQVGTICWLFQKSRYFKAPISKFSGTFGSLVFPREPILSLLKMSLVSLQWPANWLHFPHIISLKTRDYEIEEERVELDMRIPLSHMRHMQYA